MGDADLILLFWFGAALVWIYVAYCFGKRVGRQWNAVITVAFGFWLGPFDSLLLGAWLLANRARLTMVEEERRERLARPVKMVEYRTMFEADRLPLTALLDYAKHLEEDKRTDEALVVLDRALQINPTSADLWRLKGQMHWKLGQRPEEQDAYARAESLSKRIGEDPVPYPPDP